ncbi:pentapeptide repeat-containing protein [Actinoplanes sp. NPDC051513]|uniref:pentapeptide repeat-containing protein n=1 Tax=Actinoplanes sp. NPDC051513 TaxID=3363908 RepID=UPI0037987A1A
MGHRERWLSADGQRTAAKVLRRLRWGRSLEGLGLPTVGGRLDLRGFALPEPDFTPVRAAGMTVEVASGKLPEFRKLRLRGVDLTGSRLRHLRLTDARLEDCLLREADLTDLRAWRCWFDNCDLAGADITDAVLSARHRGAGTTWRNCSFESPALDGISAEGAEFQGCAFERVAMTSVVFDGCGFTDCRVTGSLVNVTFSGSNPPRGAKPATMTNFDLRDCRLTDVDFMGLRLAGVLLPPQESVVVLPHAGKLLDAIRSAIAGNPEYRYLNFWVDYRIKHHEADDDLYLDYDEIRQNADERSVTLLREVISRVS